MKEQIAKCQQGALEAAANVERMKLAGDDKSVLLAQQVWLTWLVLAQLTVMIQRLDQIAGADSMPSAGDLSRGVN